MKKYFIFIALLVLIFSIGSVCAEDIGDNSTLEVDDASIEADTVELEDMDNNKISDDETDSSCLSTADDTKLEDSSDVIVVNNWEELKDYAGRTDKNYIVKLKENTNFYPKSLTSISYQIRINNNLTIIGSNGSYIGDSVPNLNLIGDDGILQGRYINYAPIVVPDNNGVGVTVENVTFKWIYNSYKNDAVFFTMGGNSNNTFKNCVFKDIELTTGHSCIVYIRKGDATLENCSFINCTTDFGCVSIYNKDDDPYGICTSARMVIKDCYFENNYARTEPGCVNNCGIVVIYNTTFIKNRSFWWGGAIHTHGGANTTVYNCEFIDNVAGWNGGAIFTYSWLQVYNSTFRSNKCYTNNGGGAIGTYNYLTTPHVYIENSLFEDNANLCLEMCAGGAISAVNNGNMTVYNSTFVHNYASYGCGIAVSTQNGYTIIIEGNKFINHTYPVELLEITTRGSEYIITNNYFLNDGIGFSIASLNVSEPIDEKVNVSFSLSVNRPSIYDTDIIDKCTYDIYVDGKYEETISETTFALNFEDVESHEVYIIPSFSIYRSNVITVSVPRDYIYVSKKSGNDNNDGLTKQTPVYSLSKAIELARSNNHILLMDGAFDEENLNIDYRLTIWGTNESSIGESTLINSMFNVENTKFSLRNLTISNLKSSSSNSKLINGNLSNVFIDNCIIESNTLSNFINSYSLGITNSLLKNNEISFNINSLTIQNSDIENNINTKNALFNSNNLGDWIISESLFNNNDLEFGLFNCSFSSVRIENSVFENNTGTNKASCINLGDETKLIINSSQFENNNITLIYKHDSKSGIIMRNSIILNNDNFIDGDFNNIDCDYNWWGNTYENMMIQPNFNSQISIQKWLFLNISCLNEVEHGINYDFNISLDNLITTEGKILTYNNYQLPQIIFRLCADNVTINNIMVLSEGHSKTTFSLSGVNDASITTTHGIVSVFRYLNFVKTNPERTITTNEIMVGENGTVSITLPKDVTGNITIKICNVTETKIIENKTIQFEFNGIPAGNHILLINYSGDDKYESFSDEINFVVNKFNSTTKISVGKIKVSEDVILTIEVSENATGNVTLIINEIETNLNITGSKLFYTINNITRGDWEVKAIYNGDYKYKSSEDSTRFEVEKSIAEVIINLQDIAYGEDVNIQIFMNNDVTGNVTVIIEDICKSTNLINGRASFTISNLTAGYKEVQIKYTGDNYYASQDYSSVFYIEKLDTNFDIAASTAKEGQNIIVDLSIPIGVTGNFTISVENISEVIPISPIGEVTWYVSSLPVGNHTLTATYNGQNYKTCKKSITITILPWEDTQWPNEGYDVQNSGKSPYDSRTNGELDWIIETDEEIIGNIAIDNSGNICIITTKGIYSFDKHGNQNWKYNSHYSIFSGMVIGREVIISPVSGDTLYFINQTNGQKYGYSNIWQGSSIFTPVIDEKCNLYISGEKIYDTGKYNLVIVPYDAWEYGGQVSIDLGDSAPTTAPVVVNDNIVCLGTEKGLKLIDISQEKVISNINIMTSVRPVVGDGGIIYAFTSNEIYAIDSAGNQLWKSNTSGESKYLAIDNENSLLYSIDKQDNLYKHNILDNGAETLILNLNITSGILIGNDGTLYLGADTTFIALDSNGEFLWKSNIGETITGTPVMDADGNIYVTGNTTLFALTNAPLKDANLSIETANVVYGNDVKFNITLNNEATGEISVTINENTYIYNGNAEISIPNLPAGSYDVIVSYTGDKRYSSSQKTLTVNVSKIEASASNITIPAEINTDNLSFSIELASDATGTFTVSVDGVKYSAPLNNGKATVEIPKLSSGDHNIVVTYGGDSNYNPITTSKTVTVPSPATENPDAHTTTAGDSGASIEKTSYVLKSSNYKVKKSAKKLVLKATLKSSNGKPIKGKKITFKLNGKTYKAKTNKKGIAKVTIKKNVIKKLKVKKYTLKITYLKTTIKKTLTVKK